MNSINITKKYLLYLQNLVHTLTIPSFLQVNLPSAEKYILKIMQLKLAKNIFKKLIVKCIIHI